ncbi:helicase SRCAP isoform X1 [Lates japonicus]|uniref:Helicase SRCAP isoform X1 n=1 Tax=Lates japonicus TaxID=270547 RepID=A0AAD3MUA5_LATJO|nr:helicase SRCAP isoform X1 [Lates japonicus]
MRKSKKSESRKGTRLTKLNSLSYKRSGEGKGSNPAWKRNLPHSSDRNASNNASTSREEEVWRYPLSGSPESLQDLSPHKTAKAQTNSAPSLPPGLKFWGKRCSALSAAAS